MKIDYRILLKNIRNKIKQSDLLDRAHTEQTTSRITRCGNKWATHRAEDDGYLCGNKVMVEGSWRDSLVCPSSWRIST